MLGKTLFSYVVGVSLIAAIQPAYTASVEIVMHLTAKQGQGKSIGTVQAEDEKCGVLFTPNIHDLPPGTHGFHVHVKPSCEENGLAAGGHFDPLQSNEHNGPYQKKSHLGDLPILIVDKAGRASLPTLAPRFTVAQLKGHALMIHAGGDNYSDHPEKLGGGGERIACGIIE